MGLDVAKGALAALGLGHERGCHAHGIAAAAAVVGYIYPVWLRFHGGKGVPVAAGVFAVLTPLATGVAALLFLIIVWATRYVSLASIAATLALPPAAWMIGEPRAVVIAAAGTGALILFRHRGNIQRLRAGTERRMGPADDLESPGDTRRGKLGHRSRRSPCARTGTTWRSGRETARSSTRSNRRG